MITEISADSSEENSAKTISVDLTNATITVDDASEPDENEDDDDSHEIHFPNSVIPANTNVNIDGSTDVVVGTITQFHGPVTIIQNNQNTNSESRKCITNGLSKTGSIDASTTDSVAKLVATEALPGKPTFGEIQFTKKKITLYSLLVFLFIVSICIIVSIVLVFYINNEDNNDIRFPIGDEGKNRRTPSPSRHKLIYRDRWGGRNPLYLRPQKLPVKYVIISHTAGNTCDTVTDCSKAMAQMQSQHVSELQSPDIGYNFVIGGDENIYVGRGWDAHNFHMALDTIGICFIGNYIYDILTPGMIEAAQELLKFGVENGKLDRDYILVAHNQTYNTKSPGPNIYKQIKFWPHFSPEIVSDIEK